MHTHVPARMERGTIGQKVWMVTCIVLGVVIVIIYGAVSNLFPFEHRSRAKPRPSG